MTLSDAHGTRGRIVNIGGDDQTHRRLVDMGLIGARYTVCARRGSALLVDFGDFSAVVGKEASKIIGVSES